VITVKTDNPGLSGNTEFTIPYDDLYTYNYNVDCDSDGVMEASTVNGSYTCTYDSAGIYRISIYDNAGDMRGFPHLDFYVENGEEKDAEKVLGVNQWGDIKWQSMSAMFYGCENLNDTGGWASDTPDLSEVEEMQGMFYGARVFNQPIGDWNTSTITNTAGMFAGAEAFNQPIGDWDMSNDTNMSSMFYNASAFNQPLNTWDTSHVTTMENMFVNASSFNQPLDNWDTGNVTTMMGMFYVAVSFNQDISGWDTSNVTNMVYMLNTAQAFSGHDLSGWDVSNVTDHTDFLTGAGSGNIEPNWPVGP
jgi:surface protein